MIQASGENLIFVFSLPRSGSTVLCALFGNHPEVAAPPEPWMLLRLANLLGEGDESAQYDDQIAGLALRHFVDEKWFRIASRRFAITAYNRTLNRMGGRWLVDKTPRYYHILDFIDALFPRARKIWLKRNPLDVAASYKRRWRLGKDVWLGDVPSPASLDFALGLPNLINYFDRVDDTKTELRYEDLIRAPESEMRRLSDFCGIPFDPEMATLSVNSRGLAGLQGAVVGDEIIRGSTGLRSQSAEDWRSHLTDDEIEAISNLVGEKGFLRMGYASSEIQVAGFKCFSLSERERQALLRHIRERCSLLRESRLVALYDKDSKIRWLEDEVSRISQVQADKEGQHAQLLGENARISALASAREAELQATSERLRNLEREFAVMEAEAAKRERSLTTEQGTLKESLSWAVAERKERVALVASLQERVLFYERTEIPRLNEILSESIAVREKWRVELQESKKVLKETRTVLANCRQSLSYRIGRTITAPFRGVRWLFKKTFNMINKSGSL